ncbi:MAG: stage V sporulation protein AA [Defluviitaleaceae bacterium]|nr:stage V sporulation protein AA [Defluviitaleaceae bacterium]
MEIYIKPKKKAEIAAINNNLYVKDVAEVYTDAALREKAENVKLTPITKGDTFVISAFDIIKAISAALPSHPISNVGEIDTLVSVAKKPPKKSKIWSFIKIAFICIILFAGSTSAIMAFHTDSQLGTVFKQFHKIFVGEEIEKPLLINIPYSIGLALGIMVFFNHFAGRKFTKEPSPIQVEMEIYEKDIEDALIQHIDREQENAKKGGDT